MHDLEGEAPESPEVHRGAMIGLPRAKLWGHVRGGPADGPQLPIAADDGEAKVAELNGSA